MSPTPRTRLGASLAVHSSAGVSFRLEACSRKGEVTSCACAGWYLASLFLPCQLISDLYTVRVDKMKENVFNHNLLSLSGLGRYLILFCVWRGGVFVHLG